MKQTAKAFPSPSEHYLQTTQPVVQPRSMLLYMLAFVLCVLISVAPLSRLAGVELLFALPTHSPLIALGAWLPPDLGFTAHARASRSSTGTLEFLALIALMFVIYGLCMLWIQRQSPQVSTKRILRYVWLGVLIAGIVYVLTPAMISHDIFVYASYGRLITVYHANPYFVTLAAHRHDPFFTLDDWRNATSAYGPIWLAICSLCALLIGPYPLAYVLTYRLFGLMTHLLNILLVTTTLRTLGRTPRTVALGTLLYAWNPLTLLESSLGGHNDSFMITLLLLSIFLYARTEVLRSQWGHGDRKGSPYPHPFDFIPSLITLTLAAAVKFTVVPLIALFLILLLRTRTRASAKGSSSPHSPFRTMSIAGLLSGAIALASYAPFWIGHSISGIVQSFGSPPSSYSAYGSILFALTEWKRVHHGFSTSGWASPVLHILSLHSTWTIINVVTLIGALFLGAIWLWRVPTTRTFALASLTTLGALLIVTPWFFPWYVTWIVALAAICLPSQDYAGRGLVAFTLAFSASAFCSYLFYHGYPPIGGWIGYICLTTVGPPLLALLLSIFTRRLNE